MRFSIVIAGRVAQSVARLTQGFDTRSGHIISFPLPLIKEGQLSVTGESIYTWHRLIAKEVLACPGIVWLGYLTVPS